MPLSTKYNPREVEDKWYQHWMDMGFFRSKPNKEKEPYTIVIPPPNVTGVLHMGHMLNNTIQDVLTRKARMEGKEALWVPGTDHASIATEAKVVAMLKEKGIKKRDITREEFVNYAWEWRKKYGGIILEQLKKLGASCDWDRTTFTMDDDYYKVVINVFVDLYNKGHIYKGTRMINWDPVGLTAIADDEVIHKEVNSHLYYIKYKIDGEEEFLTVATTRPETILGDTAICINPNDERHHHLKGKRALVPLINRSIPVIEDVYVSMEFGTGCLKITPAHDANDYELGKKHKLESIDILNEDGSLGENATLYIGEDRFAARKMIVKDLQEVGQIVKIEDYVNNIGFSERTDSIIEPRLSEQWFVSMKELTKPALENVLNNTIKFHPSKFKNMYRHWMENVRDWCISRQLWWGHRIPAYYLKDGSIIVAETPEKALQLAKEKTGNNSLTPDDLKQDEDVLDTWFSSGLWPINVFKGLIDPDNEDINYYYPTNDLITAPEILFFWVARMILFGYEYRGQYPFKNVYLTGIVRDEKRRKMSKSLGNSPDPLELIKKYGADGMRTGMLFSSPAGNDLLFDVKLLEQGRNFANKIWNAFRLIKGWNVDESANGDENQVAIDWFDSRLNQAILELEDHYSKFRISDSLLTLYKLFWDDYASWFLEWIKPAYQHPIDKKTKDASLVFLEKLIKLLHPFMPFITEEIWHGIKERDGKDCIIVAEYPKTGKVNKEILNQTTITFDIISKIRYIRSSRNISPKEELMLLVKSSNGKYGHNISAIKKLARVSYVEYVSEKPEGVTSFVVKSNEFYIPLDTGLDKKHEREKLSRELEYTLGFLKVINKKLTNEKFVNNAPAQVVETEKKKKADAESKIKILKESLNTIDGST